MSVKFFKRLSVLFCAVVCFGSVLLAGILKTSATKSVRAVYFVLTETESVQASAGEISLRGGAGYPIDGGVAFGVYFSLKEAEAATVEISKEYANTYIRNYSIKTLDKKGNLGVIFTSLQLVQGWIDVLEKGGRQSVVKNGLSEISSVLIKKGEDCKDILSFELGEELEEIASKTVFASELRFFLCSACDRIKGERIHLIKA